MWIKTKIEKIISGLFFTVMFLRIIIALRQKFLDLQMCAKYSYAGDTDWLINYHGGFVRRGLMGELVLFLTQVLNIENPKWILISLAGISALLLIAIFVYLFKKNQLPWFVLPMSIFLGLEITVRKDNLLLLLFAGLCYCMARLLSKNSSWSIIPPPFCLLSLLLMLIGINIHESFFFFSFPIFFFCIFSNKRLDLLQKFISIVLPLVSFILCIVFKGNEQIVKGICDSWPQLTDIKRGGIDALTWNSLDTFKFHFTENFIKPSLGIMPIFVRPIIYILTFIVAVYGLFVFSTPLSFMNDNRKNQLASILMIQFVCLLPMFTILSCDMGRVVIYWTLSSYLVFLLMPSDVLDRIVPTRIRTWVTSLTRSIEYLPINKYTIGILILFLTITPIGFDIPKAFLKTSSIGSVIYFTQQFLERVI